MSGWGATSTEDPFEGLRVAWCGRTSTEDLQDPAPSLPPATTTGSPRNTFEVEPWLFPSYMAGRVLRARSP